MKKLEEGKGRNEEGGGSGRGGRLMEMKEGGKF